MTEKDRHIWNTEYLQPLIKKFEEVPVEFKYLLIEKDYIGMFGKTFTNSKLSHLYEESEEFIFGLDNAVASLSKTVKINLYKKYCEINRIKIDINCKWLKRLM